jgi:hypothetical protein
MVQSKPKAIELPINWWIPDSISVRAKKLKLSWWYIGVLVCALALYTVSCAPATLWQDSGLIQYRIWHNDIEGFLGLALSHPLFYIIAIVAKYVPLGEFFYRVNLVSAIAGAVTIANIFLLVRLWLGRNLPAVVAAVTLAVSHTFWSHASIIETYTLWTAIFTAELIMLLQYVKTERTAYLYWLGLLNGLAIAVHNLALIPFLCYAVFVIFLLAKKNIHLRDSAIIVLLWIVGALLYEYLIIKNIIQSGDVTGSLASAAFGVRWQGAVLNTSLSAKIIKENFLFILLNFPTPNFLLFFAGLFGLFKVSKNQGFRNVLLGLIVLFFIFAFRYNVPDRFAFFLPFYCMVSVFVGLGAYFFLEQINRKVFVVLVLLFSFLPVAVYAVAPAWAEKMQFNLGTRNNVPYRNDYKYFLQPWKTGYRGAEHFADEALDVVEKNAIIFADSTTAAPLLLMQEVAGKRLDVKVISGVISSKNAPSFNKHTIEQLLQGRAVYVVSRQAGYCPSFVLDNYNLEQVGHLWRVVEREKNGG